MALPPLLASLTRHRLIVALMMATTAFSCAVVANIAVMFVHRAELLRAPSGVRESEVVVLDSSRVEVNRGRSSVPDETSGANYDADIVALRGIGGVDAAAALNGVPFGGGAAIEVGAEPAGRGSGGTVQVTAYAGGKGALNALGLRLSEGRDFLSSEYVRSNHLANLDKVQAAVMSRQLANRLFHSGEASGRLFFVSGHPVRVVGIVDHLMGMAPQVGAPDNEFALLLPLEPDDDSVTFAVRTSGGRQYAVAKEASAALLARDPLRVVENEKTFADLRAEYFQREHSMISMLLAAGLAMLIVTAGGIVGLTSFWVQQRTRAIGIRRALGAQRRHIFAYFVVENFLIVTGGVLIGGVLAYALNAVFIDYFEVPVIPFGYIVTGAVALWVTGQIAGAGPAWRAAAVSPDVATRSG